MKLAIEELKSIGMRVETPRSSYTNRKAFYNYIVKSGGEGGIFKRD